MAQTRGRGGPRFKHSLWLHTGYTSLQAHLDSLTDEDLMERTLFRLDSSRRRWTLSSAYVTAAMLLAAVAFAAPPQPPPSGTFFPEEDGLGEWCTVRICRVAPDEKDCLYRVKPRPAGGCPSGWSDDACVFADSNLDGVVGVPDSNFTSSCWQWSE